MLERRSHPHLPSPIVLRWSSLVLALLLLASLGGPAIAQTAADDHPIRIGIVGDLVESSRSPAQVAALFNQATGILDQLPVPWFLTAGDHDVNPPAFQQDSPDRSREQLFQQLYGARVPAFAVHPYYSFDLNGYHFISLYSFGA